MVEHVNDDDLDTRAGVQFEVCNYKVGTLGSSMKMLLKASVDSYQLLSPHQYLQVTIISTSMDKVSDVFKSLTENYLSIAKVSYYLNPFEKRYTGLSL